MTQRHSHSGIFFQQFSFQFSKEIGSQSASLLGSLHLLGNISSLQEGIADGLADLKETGDYIGFVKHVRGGLAESYYKVRSKWNLAEIGDNVVVQFYHVFKIHFPLFQNRYHKLPYPKTK